MNKRVAWMVIMNLAFIIFLIPVSMLAEELGVMLCIVIVWTDITYLIVGDSEND